MNIAKLGAAIIVGALAFAATPALAESQLTQAFLANVRPNVDFLDRSSRLAAEHSKTQAVRDYALAATVEIRLAANEELTTGRSAASDVPMPAGIGQAANGRQAPGDTDVAKLTALSGKAFDDFYWEKQLDALSQLASDYRLYTTTGDDPKLIALSRRELPRVEMRLKELSKL